MSIRALITLTHQSAYAPAAIAGFSRCDLHGGIHVWQGRALSVEEFNRSVSGALVAAQSVGIPASVVLIEVDDEEESKPPKKEPLSSPAGFDAKGNPVVPAKADEDEEPLADVAVLTTKPKKKPSAK